MVDGKAVCFKHELDFLFGKTKDIFSQIALTSGLNVKTLNIYRF